jgi:hypothetical protein
MTPLILRRFKIVISGGLIKSERGDIVEVALADKIARANECLYAEGFCKKYDGQTLILNGLGKIIPGETNRLDELFREVDAKGVYDNTISDKTVQNKEQNEKQNPTT